MEPLNGKRTLLNGTRTFHVMATTEQGTLAALQKAADLARPHHSPVVVLVPDVVEYGTSLDHSDHQAAVIAASYRDLAARIGLPVAVRVCACRDVMHLAGRLMLSDADIIVGGRRRSWRTTREQQLARRLACEGHHVTFVDVDTGQSREEWVA